VRMSVSAVVVAVAALLLTPACAASAVASSVHQKATDPVAVGHATAPPAHPRWESTGLMADWTDPVTGLNVGNNMWNCPQAACGREEIWANSSSDWGVVSTMAKGNTAVLTYPNVQETFGANDEPASLANARQLVSTFAEQMPTTSGTISEAAYDIWLNNWNTEIMIWVDNQHQRFYIPVRGTITVGGQKFSVYAYTGTSGGYPSGPFDFVLQGNETSGTVNILGAIQWLEKHGYISANGAGINAVDFGWEICSTGGHPEDFSVSHFTISTQGI
jgi:hypothetical protein